MSVWSDYKSTMLYKKYLGRKKSGRSYNNLTEK